MRLDRYLSNATALSRSQAQQAIRQGRVKVAGLVVKRPAEQVSTAQRVVMDELPLAPPGPRYFMLHKPAGYVCSTHDPHNSSVLALLDEARLDGLHFVGRLDIDTTGLVLITDDGDWSHRITSPGRHCPKTYLATLAEPLSAPGAARLRQGILLRNETRPTRPAQLQQLSPTRIRLVITEGRYHQVKRMLAAVGNRVTALHREAVGRLVLDAGLPPGRYRALSREEIAGALED